VFDLGDRLLFVATDRISAFDCVMPNGIPRKGEVLTQLSHFWFDLTESWLPNHRLAKAGMIPARPAGAVCPPASGAQRDREKGPAARH
jgi:phosphoribosylaminoimidazole-succinocarboxamide synthase